MAHRFGLGTPGAFALLMGKMQLCAFLWPAPHMQNAAAIRTIEQTLTRPAQQLFQWSIVSDNRTPIRAICNQHCSILARRYERLYKLYHLHEHLPPYVLS